MALDSGIPAGMTAVLAKQTGARGFPDNRSREVLETDLSKDGQQSFILH
jgi:hypothetical protein